MIYAADSLYEDVAFIAYHFHWTADEIIDLEHWRRRDFVDRIARINSRANGGR